MVAVVSAVLSLDILVLGMDMDTALEVSAEGLVSTQLDLFMSQDLPKDLASAVLSPAILVMVLPPMAMLLVVSALELVSTQLDLFMSQDLPKDLASAVLSPPTLVMVLPPMAMLLVV